MLPSGAAGCSTGTVGCGCAVVPVGGSPGGGWWPLGWAAAVATVAAIWAVLSWPAALASVDGWLAGWCPDDLLGLGADPVQEPLRQTQQDRDPRQLGGWQPGKTGAHVQGW